MSPLALSLRLLQTQPDERLVQLARSGHEPAFEALVRRYRRPLLAYCRRLSVPDAGSEDILQQALLQAWRALAAGAEIRDVRAWLYRIVHNVAISSGARRLADGHAELGDAVRTAGVEQLVEQRLAARDALAGLAALPELQREVMLGTALEGRSHEEVAGALGLTSGSVRGLIYRARATLRAAAAVLVPGPVVDWALRQHQSARGTAPAVYEALAGGGSAGVAGVVLKGGAIATVAGALAGTAALITAHPAHQFPRARVAIASPARHHRSPPAERAQSAPGVRLAAVLTASGETPARAAEVASVPIASVPRAHSTTRPGIKQATSGGRDRQRHGGDGGGDRRRHRGDGQQGQRPAPQAFSSTADDPSESDGTDHSATQSGSSTVATTPTLTTAAPTTPGTSSGPNGTQSLPGAPQPGAGTPTTATAPPSDN
jgi:RNA polymerase sigma factor (sigma-70 family)